MLRLMIVEDEPLERQALRKIISDAFGNQIQIVEDAENGKEAIVKARKFKPDIILMDIGLPELNGLDCQKKIIEMLPSVKTIMVTAYSDFYYMQRAVQEKMVNYLLKPVRPRDLRAALENIICDLVDRESNIKKAEPAGEPNAIEKAVGFINNMFCSKLSLDMVADEVHLNPQYLSRVFKKQMQVGVMEYMNLKRIERAKELLVNTELPLYRIAQESGFGDAANFSKVFYKTENKRPSEYRKMYRC